VSQGDALSVIVVLTIISTMVGRVDNARRKAANGNAEMVSVELEGWRWVLESGKREG
jgi:hypothetical protein